jgi:hypothetical protein
MSPADESPIPKEQQIIAVAVMLVLLSATLIASLAFTESPTVIAVHVEEEFSFKIGKNVAVTTVEEPNNEPAIAVDPNDPDHIVAAGNDYGTNNGDSWLGYYVSWDGGETWSRDLIPGYMGGPISPLTGFDGAGDAVVCFDSNSNVYISGIAFKRTENPINPIGFGLNLGRASTIFVAKSTDGGETFDQISLLSNSLQVAIRFHDKEWMAVDMNNGNVYVIWAMFTVLSMVNVLLSRTTDGGNTWSVPQIISEYPAFEFGGQGSTIQVTPDSTVHCFWIDFEQMAVRYTYSTDNGGSFSQPTSICDVDEIPREGLGDNTYRTPTLLMSGVDLGETNTSGSLYVTWNDDRYGDADILLIYSNDNGQTWSEPVRVNDDKIGNGLDQFFSAVTVSPEGFVHMIFYDRRNDQNNTLVWAYYAVSLDGGETFLINTNISDVPFDGNNAPHPFIGDYIGIAATNNTAYGIWCDTREGTPDQGSTELYSARIDFSCDECVLGDEEK